MKTTFQFAVFSLSTSCLLSGCNHYELFRLAGHQQESFSNQADLLFVIDNSDSMVEESKSLATNFDDFIRDLTEGDEGVTYDGLEDAVTDYIRFVTERTGFINYRLSITTTDVDTSYGALYGDPDILTRGDKGVSDDFIANLLCEATCFRECDDDAPADCKIPSGAGTSCSTPLGNEVTEKWLDCTCGEDEWRDNCAPIGQEEGLEAIFMALCRSVPYPPDECYDIISEFTAADELTNEGMLRDDATFIPVIVTDEGDSSRRLSHGNTDPELYFDLFNQFHLRMSPVVIGPVYDREEFLFPCPTGAADWGALRYDNLVRRYGGTYIDITDPDAGCDERDFAEALGELGELLKSLADAFPLQSIPDQDTIIVQVDGRRIKRAEAYTDQYGEEVYDDGWSYRGLDNSIVLHGTAVPDYNAEVQIYYRPMDGMPRELPF